jgi:DNA-binding NarL/FixJ family response regulator
VEKELHILMIEDDRLEAIRLLRELERQGISFHSECVETREDFLQTLARNPPDLILADQGQPSFTTFEALELAREKCPHVPFVFVTSQYDQGLMVEMFDNGAAGCVCKSRLLELGAVVRRALDEAVESDRKRTEEAPGELPAPQTAFSRKTKPEDTPRLICSHCKKICDENGTWEELEAYLQKHGRATVTLSVCPSCAPNSFWRELVERRNQTP